MGRLNILVVIVLLLSVGINLALAEETIVDEIESLVDSGEVSEVVLEVEGVIESVQLIETVEETTPEEIVEINREILDNNDTPEEMGVIYVDLEEVINVGEEITEENESFTGVNDSIFEEINRSEGPIINSSEQGGGLITNSNDSISMTSNKNQSVNESSVGIIKKAEKVSEKKIKRSLIKDGQIEVEFETLESENVDIKKKEIIETKLEKIVQISSKEHFDSSLRVYSNLPSPAKKEDITLYWETGNEVISLGIEYYDLNEDNFVERISWVVPHLSTQNYKIIINASKKGSSTNSIGINVLSPKRGIVENPILFDININYTNLSALNCNLSLSGQADILFKGDEKNKNIPRDFGIGRYNWTIFCEDRIANLKANESDYFEVRDEFNIRVDASTFVNTGASGTLNSPGGLMEVKLKDPDNVETSLVTFNGPGPHQLDIGPKNFTTGGNYTLIASSNYYNTPSTKEAHIYVASANLSFPLEADKDSNVQFDFEVDSVSTGLYILKVNGIPIDSGPFTPGKFKDSFTKVFSSTGNFDVLLEVYIDSVLYTINGGELKIVSVGDTENPNVKLIYPDWEDVIRSREITFSYKVKDNVKINNCSLELFNATKSPSRVYSKEELIFPLSSADKSLALNEDVRNDVVIEIKLVDFDNGDYIWDVECYDNSSNEGSDFNYFEVDLGSSNNQNNDSGGQNYSRKAEVDYLIKSINSFLEKEPNYGIKEREVIDSMGISKDMALHKKRLIQIDQDFRFNLRFVEPNKKASREKELNNEIDGIREKIVIGVEVGGDYEFSKNSLDMSLEEIIEDYLSSTGTEIKRSALRLLVDANRDLQGNLKTKVTSKKVKLRYLDRNKDIILVEKNFQLSEKSIQTLFEVLPEEIRENVIFLVGGKKIGGGMYQFDLGDLEDNGIVYYFEDSFDLKKIEETESVLFSEEIGKSRSLITGMVSGIGDSINLYSFFFVFLIASVGYVGFFVFGKVRMESWKKDINVGMIIDLVNQTKSLIRNNDVENARENYNKMKELYKLLPRKCKAFFYGEIKKVRLAINKKDVLNLVKEYELAKEDFRKEDAVKLHKKISEIYKKLPKKYQDKVYQRIVKKEV